MTGGALQRTVQAEVGREHDVNNQDAGSAARAVGIAQAFRQSARLHADRIAVESEDGTRLTYRELDRLSGSVASFMLDRGIRRGDRVAVMSDPAPAYVAVNVAGAKIGVTVVGVNTRSTAGDVAYCVEDSRARMLFFGADYRAVVEGSGVDVDLVELELAPGGDGGDATLGDAVAKVGDLSPPELGQPHDIHTVIYTSGTTGRPKGAMISQGAAAVRGLRLMAWFGLTQADAYLGWSPLFHTGGEEPLNATLMSGGRFMTFRKANPEQLVEAIEHRGGTWSWLLPGMFAEFLSVVAAKDAKLRGYRFAGGYGNLLPTRLIDDLVSRGPAFYDLFGQTESSLLVASNRIDRPGESEWKKLPAPLLDVRVVREDGTEADVGEPGECVVRGPSVMSGYMNQPEATAEVFRDGWLHTGDILERSADGALVFADRKRYLIKTGGENVYPLEVETAVAAHRDVAEVCVVGVPDEKWGETVKAFVVVRPGSTADRAAIDAHCRERLAGFKRPRLIEFIQDSDVPRSVTGKILRAELAQRPITEDQRVQ